MRLNILSYVGDLSVTLSHDMDVVYVKEGEVNVFVIFFSLVTSAHYSHCISIYLET